MPWGKDLELLAYILAGPIGWLYLLMKMLPDSWFSETKEHVKTKADKKKSKG